MAGITTPTTGSRENKPKGGREKRERRDGDFQKEKSPYTERVIVRVEPSCFAAIGPANT